MRFNDRDDNKKKRHACVTLAALIAGKNFQRPVSSVPSAISGKISKI